MSESLSAEPEFVKRGICARCGTSIEVGGVYHRRRFCPAGECREARRKERQADPEVRKRQCAYTAKHKAKPETQAKLNTPEARAARNAAARAYWNRPENKARRELWLKAYYARPGIKERKAEYERKQRKTIAYKAWFREYTAARLRESVKLRVHRSMTSRIGMLIHEEKGGRSWQMLVGYTRDQLMRHLERQFTRGMSWNNYGRGKGRWHIDHITPVSVVSFATADDPAFKALWALANLRPMWGVENISKGGRRTHLL